MKWTISTMRRLMDLIDRVTDLGYAHVTIGAARVVDGLLEYESHRASDDELFTALRHGVDMADLYEIQTPTGLILTEADSVSLVSQSDDSSLKG
jgi:hypothetical protein